jgi:hypothetical protein
VDASSPKDKQMSQAKSFVQQKRKALADLFKYLTKMGLNYRTGLVILAASSDDLYDFTIPPIDLDAAISYLKSRYLELYTIYYLYPSNFILVKCGRLGKISDMPLLPLKG